MTTSERSQTFIQLGTFLNAYLQRVKTDPSGLPETDPDDAILTRAIRSTLSGNPWFIFPNVILSLQSIAGSLAPSEVELFAQRYLTGIREPNHPVTVCVIMAGNVPLVGFHDFFCVILSGNQFIGKLSSEDKYLLPALAGLIIRWFPAMEKFIGFSEGLITRFDAVIATGSNNTSRYFDYYFGKYPHIIRRNRNSVAVLNGTETPEELEGLGTDIFSHFGRGCRNVSRLFLPDGYSPETLFPCWSSFHFVMDHHKYRNNYDYQKSIFIINNLPFPDNGMILLSRSHAFSSPVAVLNYEFYGNISSVNTSLGQNRELIQCIVSNDPAIDDRVPFGKAQRPSLFDFADRIDTMDFLISLSL